MYVLGLISFKNWAVKWNSSYFRMILIRKGRIFQKSDITDRKEQLVIK